MPNARRIDGPALPGKSRASLCDHTDTVTEEKGLAQTPKRSNVFSCVQQQLGDWALQRRWRVTQHLAAPAEPSMRASSLRRIVTNASSLTPCAVPRPCR